MTDDVMDKFIADIEPMLVKFGYLKRGDSDMNKCEREYDINELFEFDEGTEFIVSSITLENRTVSVQNGVLKVLLAGEYKECGLSKGWLDTKFKLKRKEKEVDVMEAMRAFDKEGKTIKVIYENSDEGSRTEETFAPIEYNGKYYFGGESPIAPYAIAYGTWYVLD